MHKVRLHRAGGGLLVHSPEEHVPERVIVEPVADVDDAVFRGHQDIALIEALEFVAFYAVCVFEAQALARFQALQPDVEMAAGVLAEIGKPALLAEALYRNGFQGLPAAVWLGPVRRHRVRRHIDTHGHRPRAGVECRRVPAGFALARVKLLAAVLA